MASNRSESSPTEEELQACVDRLEQRIEVLTQAVDELTDQLEWRNNRDRDAPPTPPPVSLRSMPADPTTDDWQLNRVPAEEVDQLRTSLTTAGASMATHPARVEQLSHEIAQVRQFLSLAVLVIAREDAVEVMELFDRLLGWAYEEFQPELSEQFLSDVAEDESPVNPVLPPTSVRPPAARERQGRLFTEEAADGHRPAE